MAVHSSVEKLLGWIASRPIVTLEYIDQKIRSRQYVRQQARWTIGTEKPTRKIKKLVLESNDSDALAWIICYDNSRTRRARAWKRLRKMDYGTNAKKGFDSTDSFAGNRIMHWIAMEGRDNEIRLEAQNLLPKSGPWSLP